MRSPTLVMVALAAMLCTVTAQIDPAQCATAPSLTFTFDLSTPGSCYKGTPGEDE